MQEMKEMQAFVDIEHKIASANAKRQEKLAEVAKSSSKKRLASPKPSPTKCEIEARINEAARRREMFLLNKIDKATASSSKKLSPRADLFANTTPRLDDTDRRTSSPRMKAAKLEDIKDVEGFTQHYTMMPIIATGIALALVGVFSYWRH